MFTAYLLIGTIAGLMSGLFGIGGGVIIIPALAKLFAQNNMMPISAIMHMAIGTSLATVIFTSLASLRAHHKRNAVHWNFVRLLTPGLIIGSTLGAAAAGYLSSGFLRIFFGLFLFLLGLHLLFNHRSNLTARMPSANITRFFSFCVGILASLLGVGGGILLIPFLLRCQLDMRGATGTSVIGALVIGIVATTSFMLAGIFSPSIEKIAWSTGYVYWPAFFGIIITSILFAPIGASLAHKLPRDMLRRFFAVFILLMACDMLFLTR